MGCYTIAPMWTLALVPALVLIAGCGGAQERETVGPDADRAEDASRSSAPVFELAEIEIRRDEPGTPPHTVLLHADGRVVVNGEVVAQLRADGCLGDRRSECRFRTDAAGDVRLGNDVLGRVSADGTLTTPRGEWRIGPDGAVPGLAEPVVIVGATTPGQRRAALLVLAIDQSLFDEPGGAPPVPVAPRAPLTQTPFALAEMQIQWVGEGHTAIAIHADGRVDADGEELGTLTTSSYTLDAPVTIDPNGVVLVNGHPTAITLVDDGTLYGPLGHLSIDANGDVQGFNSDPVRITGATDPGKRRAALLVLAAMTGQLTAH